MSQNQGKLEPNGAMGFLQDIRAFILCCATTLVIFTIWSVQTQAHLAWFAPYIVDAASEPLMVALTK